MSPAASAPVVAQLWWYLALAIVAEVIATSALKSADGFTRLGPAMIVIAGYGVAFYFLSLALRGIPVGIAYAVWSGVGIVLISLIGWLLHGQTLDLAAGIGIGLIVAGVVVLNVFSKAAVY
jgi:small multidrug resistance pump